jgi:SnoaL-like protein
MPKRCDDMNRDGFQGWLDRYIEAWRSGDPAAIGDLFTEDVAYSYRPWTNVVRGRDAVVADWLRNPDEPGSWEAEYHPVAVDGDVAVSVGESRYPAEGRTFSNVFVCRFDETGRCREFSEWWVEKPRPE